MLLSFLLHVLVAVQNDSMNGKNPSSSVTSTPGRDDSPLTDTPPALPKFSAAHSDVGAQQFKSPRLQQLLGNRTAAAGSQNPPVAGAKSTDGSEPAGSEVVTSVPSNAASDNFVPADGGAGTLSPTAAVNQGLVPAGTEGGKDSSSTTASDSLVPAESEAGTLGISVETENHGVIPAYTEVETLVPLSSANESLQPADLKGGNFDSSATAIDSAVPAGHDVETSSVAAAAGGNLVPADGEAIVTANTDSDDALAKV